MYKLHRAVLTKIQGNFMWYHVTNSRIISHIFNVLQLAAEIATLLLSISKMASVKHYVKLSHLVFWSIQYVIASGMSSALPVSYYMPVMPQ